MGSLGAGVDALAQVNFLLRAQQRDLADLLEVVLDGVVQQLIHRSLQVGGVLLGGFFLVVAAQTQLVAVVLGVLHLGDDAVHVQIHIGVGLILDDLDAALFKERIERFHIHPALCSQSFGLLCRQGAFAFRQQFLQSHAHFALSFSPRGKRPASELVS